MFKKTFLAGLILAVSAGSALASGFYAGAGAGTDSLNNKANITDDGNTNYGNTGVLGGLFAGYQYNFANHFNLGGEAFANATSTKFDDYSYASPVSFKARYNYGVRALPGYNITPYIETHAILGFVRGNFENTLNSTVKYNANGFQAGWGASADATKHVAIRGDLIYSHYQTKTTTDVDGNTFKNQVRTVDAIVSALYKFG